MIKNRMLPLQLNTVLLLLCMKSGILGFGSAMVVENGNNNITTTKCIGRERQSLLIFKESLVDRYGRLSSWGSEEDKKECCKWSGVHCSNRNGHVIMLNLSAPYSSKLKHYLTLRGNISNPSLLELHHLRYLDLAYNDFGSTPIPNFIGSLPKLKYLDLSHASFGGIIPFQLGNLSKLHHLDLSFNSFDVSALQTMEWLSRLSSLTHLSLGGNQLESLIPNSLTFANLCNLISLDLSRNNLSGTLSSLLKELACADASLESLILTSNELTGSVNGDHITRFSSLRKLSLDRNRLIGFLPIALGQLSKLQHLDVSVNSLRGIISEAHFLNLSKLNYLDLSVNNFFLELSSQWTPPFQLDTVILASCTLGPLFPRWLQTQTKISHLNLSNNRISDNIPTWFWNQTTGLQFLDLSFNELEGMLPDLSSKFVGYPSLPSSLVILNLSGNKFSGRLSFLCSITNWTLTFLDLSDNLFSGGFLGCFDCFQELIVLNLAHNKLSGKIPSYALSSVFRLETLVLCNNNFFGELPSTFRHSTFLKFMDLSGNKLSGSIPAWIGENLPKLYVLNLRSNKFNGSVPLQLCHLTKLRFLDLSLNSLSGSIPRCFGNFTAMSQEELLLTLEGISIGLLGSAINLSSNKLTGEIPEEITNLKGLEILNVSSNQLCGVIPLKIGRLENLESLDLSSNKFSGEIPPSMVQMNFLSRLNLSYNNFSGEIPPSMVPMNFWSLNLSYNNFSGRIPMSNEFEFFENSSYLGNIGLCGPPLTRECPKDDVIVGGGNDFCVRWFCMVIALGFSTGFWEFVANYLLFNHH